LGADTEGRADADAAAEGLVLGLPAEFDPPSGCCCDVAAAFWAKENASAGESWCRSVAAQ